ncbi:MULTISPECIES: type II toxin-antitoxin system VapB family antitoxin [unclassified Endozoicomonas]|uniref:type II toxin-antitoxin system VapB family antitoxin n=1 Tax=unclassified Endozoicomonas TaxID=2644528 RepID=UPI003BB75C86
MPSNLALDDDSIDQVQKLGGYKTKKAAVNEALAEFIRHRKQLELLDDFGTIMIGPILQEVLTGIKHHGLD